jgi:effector-binding domain-containing protein
VSERPESTTEFEIIEVEAKPTVAVRVSRQMADFDLGPMFARWLPAVAERIGSAGGQIGGPAFGRYHRFGPDGVDVEIGFVVAVAGEGLEPLASLPEGSIGRSELPGGWVARTVHRGPYDGLPPVYDALHAWIHAQPGFDDGPGPWEEYLDAPQPGADMSDVRTAVVWPLIST